jgi:beta-glucosidase
MKVFKKSAWVLFSSFWGIMLATLLVGQNVANANAGQINSFLKVDAYKVVDDSDNSTPDVMYYKSDYMQYRWHYDADQGKYVFQTRYNTEGVTNHAIAVSRQVDGEGAVLLWNKNNTLPLKEQANISLFGTSSNKSNYVTSGQGSGYHVANAPDSLQADLKGYSININPTLESFYQNYGVTYKNATSGSKEGDPNYVEYKVNEVPFDKVRSSADSSVSQYGDAAIYVISRLGSENGDTDFNTSECLENNYQDLTHEEVDTLTALEQYKKDGKIKSIVLVLNTCNAMQFKHIKDYDIDSCLWVGNGGTASFAGLADVLAGKTDPSGHLMDTYLYDNRSAPATSNFGNFTFAGDVSKAPSNSTYANNNKYVAYQEGIYVGYRYFETRYEDGVLNQGNAKSSVGVKTSAGDWTYQQEVIYPFGHGLSYASFERSNFQVSKNPLTGNYICSLTIKNTSTDHSGKDVFQVYLQKPYTSFDIENKIEKASVELVGFNKTKTLAPGESQTLQVEVKPSAFATYDSNVNKTYIQEAGDYYLSYGEDSHHAINNILRLKGVAASLLDGTSDESFASLIHQDKDDVTTFSKSEATQATITNQFDHVDPNKASDVGDQSITYLSRNDWAGTYPVTSYAMTMTSEMAKNLQYDEEVETDKTVSAPTYGAKNGLNLIGLKDAKSDSDQWDKVLDQMTFAEQSKMTTWGANAMAGASSISCTGAKTMDGPAGMRLVENTVAYPSETLMASSFNSALVNKLGNAFGMEMMNYGYSGIYGPGANIHRTNFSGRNFEYYSEDPFLSEIMLDAETKGLSDRGVISFTKHFALNDQERNRYGCCIWANEQSIREIYLRPFKKASEEQHTLGLMSSLCRFGTTWCGDDKNFLTNLLRQEWGFLGVVETDAAVCPYMTSVTAMVKGVLAGQDLWMEGTDSVDVYGKYKDDPEVQQAIRTACKHNLYAQLHSNAMNGLMSGTKVVEITPWWKTFIVNLIIVAAVILALGVIMAVLSFILPVLPKHQDKVKEGA